MYVYTVLENGRYFRRAGTGDAIVRSAQVLVFDAKRNQYLCF
jgi:hypothetical protein